MKSKNQRIKMNAKEKQLKRQRRIAENQKKFVKYLQKVELLNQIAKINEIYNPSFNKMINQLANRCDTNGQNTTQ